MSCVGDDYSPPEVTFEGLYRGDDIVLPFLSEVPDPPDADPFDASTTWVARDLSGGDWRCQFRVGSSEGPVWFEANVDTSSSGDGEYDVPLPRAETEKATPGVPYFYDVERTDSERETLVRGWVTFIGDVTK